MSDFEFIFALFGLLLGLSLAEVLTGFARAVEWKLRPGSTVRIGALTPLLGAFVLLNLLSFWQAAWNSREIIAVSRHSLLAVMTFAGSYYLAASLVFPRGAEAEPDFDGHFLRVRRIVIGVMFALLLCQLGWYLTLPAMAVRLADPLAATMTVILALLMIAAITVRGLFWCRLAMAALVARYLLIYLL
jgi:uncharacterized membrane protein